jgi:hypothetical protein
LNGFSFVGLTLARANGRLGQHCWLGAAFKESVKVCSYLLV